MYAASVADAGGDGECERLMIHCDVEDVALAFRCCFCIMHVDVYVSVSTVENVGGKCECARRV